MIDLKKLKIRRIPNISYRYLAIAIILVAAVAGFILRGESAKLSAKPSKPITLVNLSYNPCLNITDPNQSSYNCYKDYLNNIVVQKGPEKATGFVKQQYDQDMYAKSACHQLMHIVGRSSYAKYGNLADAFAHGDQYCWSGYYHGIMEQLSITKGYKYLINNANKICKPIEEKFRKYSFYSYNCVHGLGHGFMQIQDENLFDALSSCDSMDSSYNRESCYGGVFMQNVMNVQGPEGTTIANYKFLKPTEPMYPCTAVKDKYKQQCYLMQTSYVLQAVGHDFREVFAQCSIIDVSYRDTCYQSLGRDASGQTISDVKQTRDICLMGETQAQKINCTIGAVKDYISYFHNDKQGYKLCAAMPTDITTTCNQTVKSYYANF
jgi:hypothetical protein